MNNIHSKIEGLVNNTKGTSRDEKEINIIKDKTTSLPMSKKNLINLVRNKLFRMGSLLLRRAMMIWLNFIYNNASRL